MEKFLSKLNELTENNYRYLRVNSVEIDLTEKAVFICLILPCDVYDKGFSDDDRAAVLEASGKIIPYPFKVKTIFKKSFSDTVHILQDIMSFVYRKYPALEIAVRPSNIEVTASEEGVKILFKLEQSAYDYFINCGVETAIKKYLYHLYCDDFIIDYEVSKDTNTESAVYTDGQKESIKSRFVEISKVAKIIGRPVVIKPQYIKNLRADEQTAICGKVTDFYKGESKTSGLNYYTFNLYDTTGVVKVLYMPKVWKKPEDGEEVYLKAEAEYRNKIKIMDEFGDKLKEIDIGVVCEGTARYGQRNDLAFFLRNLSYCDIDFSTIVVEKTFTVPENYQRIFPTPYIDTVKKGDKVISNFLKNKRIVVFDFETTGIDPTRDKPIEIGAVSIENGEIKEQFSTFINPGFPIPTEITELTHITDEDVKDAPSIEEVLPDFYKFSDGAILAAHNIDFDYAFLKNYGKPLGISFNNPINDTLAMGRARYSNLPNHKLETLCGHLNIVNEGAHRAIYDAISTARLYICLVE